MSADQIFQNFVVDSNKQSPPYLTGSLRHLIPIF